MKICRVCKEEKDESQWFKSQPSLCIECIKGINAAYYQKNKERYSARGAAYYQQNKEKLKKYSRAYYSRNKERHTESCKKAKEKREAKKKLNQG